MKRDGERKDENNDPPLPHGHQHILNDTSKKKKQGQEDDKNNKRKNSLLQAKGKFEHQINY